MNNLKALLLKYKFIILYGIFGVLTTLINIVTYSLLYSVLGFSNVISNIIAWVLSVLFAFITNKLFVFSSKSLNKKVIMKEIFSFFFFRILSLGIDMAGMYICISLININKLVSKIIMNIIVIISNYIFSKIFIFKNKE